MSTAFAANNLCHYKFDTDIKPGFPHMIDDMTTAFHLGIQNRTMWWLLTERNQGTAYNCFGIPEYKQDGSFKKLRHIQEPMPALKNVHGSLNGIFSSVPLPKSVAAYVKGLKPSDAAAQHVRQSYWIPEKDPQPLEVATMSNLDSDPRYKKIPRNKDPHDPKSAKGSFYYQPIVAIHLDITNFFNSIRASWIRKFLHQEVGYSHYVAALLATLCTCKVEDNVLNLGSHEAPMGRRTRRFLPQGSPLSGSLSNLVGHWMFGQTISDLLVSHSADWVYTIYSDDIVMSHPDQTIDNDTINKIKDTVSKIVEDAGFKINTKKTNVSRSKYDRVKILGCVVNEKLNVPKYVYKNIKRLLHNCKNHGWKSQVAVCDTASAMGVVQYCRGMVEYIKQIREDKHLELKAIFDEAVERWPIEVQAVAVMVDNTKPEETPNADIVGTPEGAIPAEQDDDPDRIPF